MRRSNWQKKHKKTIKYNEQKVIDELQDNRPIDCFENIKDIKDTV